MGTPDITIFVRHTAGCKYEGDGFAKNCRCRKHLRWFKNGKQYFRSARTRSWSAAETAKRYLEEQFSANPNAVPEPEPKAVTIREAAALFIQDKTNQGVSASSLQKHELDVRRITGFCEGKSIHTVEGITLPIMIAFAGTWPALYPSSYSRAFFQKRLGMFLAFCKRAGFLETVPRLAPIKIDEPPTMPLSAEEYERLLATAKGKVRACIQLMRWSGLAVRDASLLRRDELLSSSKVYRVMTNRQKTGVDVCVPIPDKIAEEILAVVNGNPTYLFWNQKDGMEASGAKVMGRNISAAFTKAKIRSEGHMISHRLRDTFAVDLLEKGVPLEEVSKLLGHESVVTTERHYAKWVKGRQDRLDNLVMGTWTK